MAVSSDAVEQVRKLIDSVTVASLGTLTEQGGPFVSLVSVAKFGETSLALLLSSLALHTQNLTRRADCSVLLSSTDSRLSDQLASRRVTLIGTVKKLSRGDDANIREAYLRQHPEAIQYVGFGDFAFHRFRIESAHLVAGFGKIQTLDGSELRHPTR